MQGEIAIRDLSLEYVTDHSRFLALENINLTIKGGEFVCLIGPSGCGKSSLLGILNGLVAPTSGTASIDGVPIRGPGPERAVVFQHYSLFPWMSAKENVIFALEQVKKGSKKQHEEIAGYFLDQVGLHDFAAKMPAELSGGMQQRVAIARALAVNPRILLMDEPFGAIDAKNRESLQQLLLQLWDRDEERKTIVFVTHDTDEALLLADKIIFMLPRRIEQEIPVPFKRPRRRADFFADETYISLHKSLAALFQKNVMEQIGGAEVYL
jgi:NitT/TauT family transport system ATP-binding protein